MLGNQSTTELHLPVSLCIFESTMWAMYCILGVQRQEHKKTEDNSCFQRVCGSIDWWKRFMSNNWNIPYYGSTQFGVILVLCHRNDSSSDVFKRAGSL
jgi:hypothetical protein